MSETEQDGTGVEQLLETIKTDRSKALRAEKTAGDAEKVDDPRTAVRFLEERAGVPYFEVVTTTTTGFPLGRESVSEQTQEPVTHWCEQNDPEVIDVRDDDGFEVEQAMTDGGTGVEQSGTRYGYVTVAESEVNDPRNDIPAGRQTLHAGKNPDPDYEVFVDKGTQEITHKIVRTIELPERMTKSDAIEYVQENYSPEEDDGE